MTWLFKYILKIKNKTLMSILTILNSLLVLCFTVGFVALPFIKFGENARDFFFILWGVCFADFLAEMILTSKRQIAQNEKEARRYNKDKVVYWVSTVASVLSTAFALLLFLLKKHSVPYSGNSFKNAIFSGISSNFPTRCWSRGAILCHTPSSGVPSTWAKGLETAAKSSGERAFRYSAFIQRSLS